MSTESTIVARFGGAPFSVVGDVYDVLLRSEQTGGRFAVVEMIVAVANGPPLHRHGREDETFYVLDGELTVTVDGRTHSARSGSLVFAPRGVPNTFRNTGPAPARVLVLISPAGFERFLEEVGEPHSDGGLEPVSVTEQQIARLMEAAPRYGLEILEASA